MHSAEDRRVAGEPNESPVVSMGASARDLGEPTESPVMSIGASAGDPSPPMPCEARSPDPFLGEESGPPRQAAFEGGGLEAWAVGRFRLGMPTTEASLKRLPILRSGGADADALPFPPCGNLNGSLGSGGRGHCRAGCPCSPQFQQMMST
jgi:hypothetical protein